MPTTAVFDAVDIGYDERGREFVIDGFRDGDRAAQYRVLTVRIGGIDLAACHSLSLEADDSIVCTIDENDARVTRYQAEL